MPKLVSIIVTCYNQEKYIADCLRSCAMQAYKDIEIIFVDDCSTDESYCKGITVIDDYPDIMKVIRHETNGGVSAARNTGISMAKGKYIMWFDGDDILLPKAVEIRAKYLDEHPNVSMVWANAYKINQERGNYDWSYDQCVAAYGSLEVYSRRLNNGTCLWRKEVFEKYGLYYERLRSKEDKEFLYRLGLHPCSPIERKIVAKKIDAFVMVYRRHPQSKHKARMADKKWLDETNTIFDKRIRHLRREGITKENTRFLE